MGTGEVWGVYGVSEQVCWRAGKGCGERNEGGVERCLGCGAPTLFHPHLLPHLSLHLPLPPPHPNTLSYTSSHTSSIIFPSSPHIPTRFPIIPTSPPTSQSVTKYLWRSYHVANLLATQLVSVAKLLATLKTNVLSRTRCG